MLLLFIFLSARAKVEMSERLSRNVDGDDLDDRLPFSLRGGAAQGRLLHKLKDDVLTLDAYGDLPPTLEILAAMCRLPTLRTD